MSTKSKTYHVGLTLSGGGTRGVAHIGVLKALDECGIKPEVISGVSAGAIVGALYASGIKPENIMDLLCRKEFYSCSGFSFSFKGLLEMKGLRSDLKKHCAKKFSDLQTPMFVGATSLNTGKIRYINKGGLVKAVIASSSLPALYSPVEFGGEALVDGGLVDNMPTTPLRDECKCLIGSNVNPMGEVMEIDNMLQIATRTFQIIARSNVEGCADCDLLVEPNNLLNHNFLNNSKAQRVYEIGYMAAKKSIQGYMNNHKSSQIKQTEGNQQILKVG